jgi:carboxylesterase
MPLIPYMPGAQPEFIRGGSVGVLCLHGFTASPDELRWLGRDLATRGATVYIPRMPGHGTSHSDITRMKWRDWYAAALDGYHVIRAQCDQVYVLGLSMGGMLSLLLASEQPVDGIAALAAPVYLNQRILPFTRWLKYVAPYTNQGSSLDFHERLQAEQERRGDPQVGRVAYARWSTSGVSEVYALSKVIQGRLSQVTAPLLLVNSSLDTTAPPVIADLIERGVGSKVIQKHTLERGGHILTQDEEHQQVFKLVGEFIFGAD